MYEQLPLFNIKPYDEEFERLYNQNLTYKQMASIKNTTISYIINRVKKLFLPKREKQKFFIQCYFCGATKRVSKHQMDKNKLHFCSSIHYQFFIQKNKIQKNTGTLHASTYRKHARKIMNALPHQIVHHIDGDEANNDPSNLLLFDSNKDHVKFHHFLRRSKTIC